MPDTSFMSKKSLNFAHSLIWSCIQYIQDVFLWPFCPYWEDILLYGSSPRTVQCDTFPYRSKRHQPISSSVTKAVANHMLCR